METRKAVMIWGTHSRVGSSFRVPRSAGRGRSPAFIYHKSIASRESFQRGNLGHLRSRWLMATARPARPDPCARRVRSRATRAVAAGPERWRRNVTFFHHVLGVASRAREGEGSEGENHDPQEAQERASLGPHRRESASPRHAWLARRCAPGIAGSATGALTSLQKQRDPQQRERLALLAIRGRDFPQLRRRVQHLKLRGIEQALSARER